MSTKVTSGKAQLCQPGSAAGLRHLTPLVSLVISGTGISGSLTPINPALFAAIRHPQTQKLK